MTGMSYRLSFSLAHSVLTVTLTSQRNREAKRMLSRLIRGVELRFELEGKYWGE